MDFQKCCLSTTKNARKSRIEHPKNGIEWKVNMTDLSSSILLSHPSNTLPSKAEYWASDCVSDGTNRCWVRPILVLCLMGAHTHSQTYKLTSQRPILQLLHPRRQLRYSGHGCTSLTTLRRKLPPIWGKTEFHFGPYTEFDRSARIGVWLVLHGTNIREGINALALTQLTNTMFIKIY